MKKTLVNKNYFKCVKPLNINYNSESTLFIKGSELSKIIKPQYIKDKRNTIENLYRIRHNNCVSCNSILYDKTGTIGYTMNYYELYNTIDSLIVNENYSYQDRINIINIIFKVFEYFEDNDFAYNDINEKNIIYYENDIKIIDLDSGIFKKSDNLIEYDSSKRKQSLNLARLVLSIIHEIPFDEIEIFLNNKTFIKTIPDNLKELYKYAASNNYNHFDSNQYIDLFDEEFINDSKLILK